MSVHSISARSILRKMIDSEDFNNEDLVFILQCLGKGDIDKRGTQETHQPRKRRITTSIESIPPDTILDKKGRQVVKKRVIRNRGMSEWIVRNQSLLPPDFTAHDLVKVLNKHSAYRTSAGAISATLLGIVKNGYLKRERGTQNNRTRMIYSFTGKVAKEKN